MKSLPVPGGAARALIDAEADMTPSFSPDGMDTFAVNRTRWAVTADHRRCPPAEPTSALLDGSAAERRQRREECRVLGEPANRSDAASVGEEAA